MADNKVSVILKRLWSKSDTHLSLKQFLGKLAKDGDQMAKDWFAHKKNSLEKVAKKLRLEKKGALIALQKAATKSARKKSKGGASKPTETVTTTKNK